MGFPAFGTDCANCVFNMQRIHDIYRPMEERKGDWREVERMLSAAVTLRRKGWRVTVYERRANIGGGDTGSDCGASLVVRALASGKSMPLD